MPTNPTPGTIAGQGAPIAATLITWGGTIAMVPGPDGAGTLVPGDAGHVVALVDELASASSTVRVTAHVEGPTSDSAEADATSLSALVLAVGAAAAAGPVLITHGTDTLSFAAGVLAASLRPVRPIVLTGATSPLGTAGSDAEDNVGAAVSGLGALPPGVWVVFASAEPTRVVVLQGGYATKRTDQPGGFGDIGDTPYGYLVDGTLLVQGAVRPRGVLPARAGGPVRVEWVWPGWLSAGRTPRAAGAATVYVLYPCATAPGVVLDAMEAELAAGTRVIAATRAGTSAAAYQSTLRLESLGVERSTLPLELVLAALLRPADQGAPLPG